MGETSAARLHGEKLSFRQLYFETAAGMLSDRDQETLDMLLVNSYISGHGEWEVSFLAKPEHRSKYAKIVFACHDNTVTPRVVTA
jgi:hypothetical protein